MPSISTKGNLMPESPIRKLVPYAEKAKQKGIKVFHLNIGQPDIETPKNAINAVKNADIKILAYSKSEGDLVLREKISEYYKTFNVLVSSSEIIVTSGASEALLFSIGSIMDPNDEIIIPEPFYANYNSFAHMAGLKVVPVTAVIEDGFSLPQMEDFEAVITSKTKAILICNPGNPTGKVYAPEAIDALAKLCLKHDLYLMADEVYREFCYGDEIAGSVMNLNGLAQNAIMIDSVSKRFSMCGARVGALVTKNVALRATVMKFAMARLSPPTLGQIASEAALLTPDAYFEDVRNRYVARRNFLVKGLNDIPHVLCPEPGGAFYAICRLPIDSGDKFCQWMLEKFDLDGDTVMMAPASGFYSTPGAGEDEVRLAYVLDIPVLEKAIACIRRALELYPGRTT